jgi:hypothetical protein
MRSERRGRGAQFKISWWGNGAARMAADTGSVKDQLPAELQNLPFIPKSFQSSRIRDAAASGHTLWHGTSMHSEPNPNSRVYSYSHERNYNGNATH